MNTLKTMGCNACKGNDGDRDKKSESSSNKTAIYDRRRRVSVRMGERARKLIGKSPILVFIFGKLSVIQHN